LILTVPIVYPRGTLKKVLVLGWLFGIPVRIFTSYVGLYMKYISSLYVTGALNIELYKKTIDMLNQRSLKIKG